MWDGRPRPSDCRKWLGNYPTPGAKRGRFAYFAILGVSNGEFISHLDPPAAYLSLAAECKNIGTWPVLVREKINGGANAMLSSPIILYDFPTIAPESPGALFDGAEIDEILTLRVH